MAALQVCKAPRWATLLKGLHNHFCIKGKRTSGFIGHYCQALVPSPVLLDPKPNPKQSQIKIKFHKKKWNTTPSHHHHHYHHHL